MSVLLVLAMGTGILIGAVTHGRVANLRSVKMRAAPLLFTSFALGLIPLVVDASAGWRRALQLATDLGVFAFLLINIARTRAGVRAGLVVAATGWALNVVVIALNGAMPVSRAAWVAAGQGAHPLGGGHSGFFNLRIIEAGPSTILRFLGDVIPFRLMREVLSIGDFGLVLGVVVVVAAGMHARTVVPVPEHAA